MKLITNILSYLWLLLLMAVTACSDLEEEVGPMKGEEEVELTIRTQVPGMKVGTRAAETENLTTITALVFNAEEELIKKVDNIVASTTDGTQGTFTLKVPLRTRSIHFIGNPTGVNLPSVPSEGDAAVTHDALKTLTTTGSLAYWGYASFADVAALRAYKNQTLTLYRNKAKISIEKAGTFNGSLAIAGLENVYKKGVLVPHNGDEFNFNLTNYDYQTLPTSVSNEEKGQEKYESTVTETYVFEHPNDEGNALFAICFINNKYYKVALAKNNSGTLSYYDIIRNHQYRIKINAIKETLGQDSYDDAVNSDPINNAEAEVEVTKDAVLTIESISASELVYNTGNKQLSMTVNIPEGVSALTINASNFTVSTTNDNLSSTGNNAFNVNNAGSVTFTLTLKDDVGSRGQQEIISVQGTAKEGYKVTNPESETIILKEQVSLQTSLLKGVNSLMYSNEDNVEEDLIVNVTVPDGMETLTFNSEHFEVAYTNASTSGNGSYSVSVGTVQMRLRLKDDVNAQTASFSFDGSGTNIVVVNSEATKSVTLQPETYDNVCWNGYIPLDWGNDNMKIPLSYLWFYDDRNTPDTNDDTYAVPVGSTLRVVYEVVAEDDKDNDPCLQFAEVKSEGWNKDGFFFDELITDDKEMGCNLSGDNITNAPSFNNGGNDKYFDLRLTESVMTNIRENVTSLFGEDKVAMAIQGGEVILKKVFVIPYNQADNGQLDIVELDFYADINGSQIVNRDNNAYEDLLLGTSSFYLKATISSSDAVNYSGKKVLLNVTFSSSKGYGNDKNGIHWDHSEIGTPEDGYGKIACNSDGTQLEFTIDPEETDYLIKWEFKTGQYYKGGDIGFTYNISNYAISDVDGTFNNFAGDTSATIGFTNEPIYLDVYSDADTDAENNISIVSGSQLVMKATLSSDIAPETPITFNLSNSTGIYNIAWNENNSASSAKMDWPDITLTVEQGQSDYYLYWYPTVSDESRTATLNFTVSGNYKLNSVGNTSYSKTVTVTPNNNQTTGTVVWNEGKTYAGWSTDYIAVNTYIPTGSVITIYTSSSSTNGGAFEMHDIEERSLRFTNVNYPVNDDNYYSVASGETSHSFTVTNETTANGNSLANGVDGLKINGNNVTITRIVVQYPSMTGEVFNRDFEDSQTINGWGENGKDNVSRSIGNENGNNYLILSNTGGFAQATIDRAYVPGNYTLTYKIKGNASNSISQVFQYFNDNQKIYDSVVVSQSVEFGTDGWKIVTLNFEVTRGCNRLLFDYTDFTGEIYIDDLRLVKND